MTAPDCDRACGCRAEVERLRERLRDAQTAERHLVEWRDGEPHFLGQNAVLMRMTAYRQGWARRLHTALAGDRDREGES